LRTKKEYRDDNKEKIREKDKQYKIDNKEKIREKDKQYRDDNKEKIREKHKQYKIDNKEKIKEKVICECGCSIRRDSLSRHKKTIKHIDIMTCK
jgi:hypothetical protein